MRSMLRPSAPLCIALVLGACASDATFMRPGGALPNPSQLEADASACRSFWPLVRGFFVGAMYGAAEGAIVGASAGGADVGAIIGAGAGGVIGLTIGAVSSAGGAGYEDCMAGKGYVQAGTGTQDLSEPVAVARHPIEMVPESFDDPAR